MTEWISHTYLLAPPPPSLPFSLTPLTSTPISQKKSWVQVNVISIHQTEIVNVM